MCVPNLHMLDRNQLHKNEQLYKKMYFYKFICSIKYYNVSWIKIKTKIRPRSTFSF